MNGKKKDDIGEEIEAFEREMETMNYECLLREQAISKARERLMRAALVVDRTLLTEEQRRSIEMDMSELNQDLQSLEMKTKDIRKSIDMYGVRVSRARAIYEKRKKRV